MSEKVWARVQDGVLETPLPKSGRLSDGRVVSGYDELDEETLRGEGWTSLEDAGPPDYDTDLYGAHTRDIAINEVGEPYVRYRLVPLPPHIEVEANVVTVLTADLETVDFVVNGESQVAVEVTDGRAELELRGEPGDLFFVYVDATEQTVEVRI